MKESLHIVMIYNVLIKPVSVRVARGGIAGALGFERVLSDSESKEPLCILPVFRISSRMMHIGYLSCMGSSCGCLDALGKKMRDRRPGKMEGKDKRDGNDDALPIHRLRAPAINVHVTAPPTPPGFINLTSSQY
jgi:hypothetical protein